MRSFDGCQTWSKADDLTPKHEAGSSYAEGPANIIRANGSLHMVMMKNTDLDHKGDISNVLAPV